MNDMILSDEQKAMQQLAYYDARGVREEELRRIFNCTSSQLQSVRGDDFYKEVLAAEATSLTEQETSIDDAWNNLEASALGGLQDIVSSTNDPRALLSMAVNANKAGRRRLGGKSAGAGATINVDELTANTKVVRLRSRFLERLRQDGSVDRMIEREAEIRDTSSGDMREDMNPREVRDLLQSSLGVDTDNLRVRRHQGPDQLPGLEIDFSHIDPDEYPRG